MVKWYRPERKAYVIKLIYSVSANQFVGTEEPCNQVLSSFLYKGEKCTTQKYIQIIN